MSKIWFILFILFPSTLSAQSFRADLQTKLQTLLCDGSRTIPTTRALWRMGIFETQLDAAFIRSATEQQPLIANDLGQLAQQAAQARGHRGFAFGLCSKTEGWMMSSPSDLAPTQWAGDSLVIDLKAMRERCATVSLHYARAMRGPAKLLRTMRSREADQILVHPSLLEAGTLSLTCHPGGRQQGPELWSLIPIKDIKADRVPFFANHSPEGTSDLISWIQDVRRSQGLKLLKTEIPVLRKFANQLVADTSIRHPHAQLIQQRDLLARKNIQILGENRVKAASNEQMAWLLWYSPTHRELLLHKNANSLGFDVAQLPHEKLLVLVLAKI